MTIRMSPIRREMAQAVLDGQVTYAPARAEWTLRGAPVSGWEGRTLREMFAEHLFLVRIPSRVDGSTVLTVRLTAATTRALHAAEQAGQAEPATDAEPDPPTV